jgi:hypothetical protein
MYASPTVGVGITAGTLAYTGFNFGWVMVAASLLIAGGLLLLRLGHRRAAQR